MLNYRKLIPMLVCLSLAGCITYTNDGYYSSPGNTAYDSDEYYGDADEYDSNYGQYEYYGNQPSVVFNINIGYGYGYGYPGFFFPNYAYYPANYGYQNCNAWSSYCYAYRPNYGWGYWPVYDYRPHHHHHHNQNPPRDHHNPPGDNDDQDDDDAVAIGDDYPNHNGSRPNPRPGNSGHLPNQIRTPAIYNGNGGMVNTTPRPIQPIPVRRPVVVIDNNEHYRNPNNVPQQPRPARPIRTVPVEDNEQAIGDDLYDVRTYNAQQPIPRNRAQPIQHDQQQNARRPQQADRNSYAQPLQADIEPPQQQGNYNNGPAPQQQPRQQQSRQGNANKPESRQPKQSKDEGDD